MKKLNAIAITLMFLASIFAGAFSALALDPLHQVPVNAYDANGAKLTVDTIKVFDATGKELGTARNVQTYTFLLSTGTYTIVAEKAGYAKADAFVPITINSLPVMNAISLKLAASSGSTGGTGGTGGTNDQTTSTVVFVDDIDFEEDAKPAQEVKVTFDVENSAEEIDAEDVEATLIVVGLDDGDDVEVEDIAVGDIEAEETAEGITATFTVPVEANEGDYQVKIQLTWEDEDGKEFKNLDFVAADKLTVEKAEHDVQITELKLDAETLQAGKSAEIAVTLLNIGQEDEKVRIKVSSEKLGISENSAEFELDEGDEATQYIPFTVSDKAEDGSYFIYATVTFNEGADQTLQFITANVKAEGATTTTGAVTVTPTVTITSEEKSGWTTMGLLIVAIVLIGVIAVLAREYMPKTAKPIVVSTRRGRR